ncbi:prolipoprotein diacylglyceryl transferase [Alloacidobacterium dinghuense]|uniref:Prolipoprotein diacylglyceryl transferase n=1 Tax=Alloacidobacterium dinghuense TaxID=2763107 RepID=A0A7G8BFR7_9BACT|nr:prolipoprotein diacylglyceryl transferase family protein [Alloacidobacterium dinghuense]QNI31387.1 prolipoprotein diacylglyceryl transferase [Alloacidobacterium dinghuense]
MHPRLFQFGHIAIPTYGVLVAIALVAALAMAVHTARRLALDPNKIWNLSLIGIFTALLGSRLILVLVHLSDFLAHPFWMLGLVTIRSRGIVYGGILLAICACIGYILSVGLPLRRTLDCLAPAVALGLAISSLGAFAAGSDYGTPTDKPWGIIYKHGLAALWSGTPLGVRLHPVQPYEALTLFLLLALLLLWLSRQRHDGDVAGTFLFAYGVALYFLDFYRGDRSFVFQGAISLTQILAAALMLAGAALWIRRKPSAL